MADTVNTARANDAHERTEPKRRKRRYALTFSEDEYNMLSEYVSGNKAVRGEDVRRVLRRRMHYE